MKTRYRILFTVIGCLLLLSAPMTTQSVEMLENVTIRLADQDSGKQIQESLYYEIKNIDREAGGSFRGYSTESGLINVNLERNQQYSVSIRRYPEPYEGRCLISVPEGGGNVLTNDFLLSRCFKLNGKVVTTDGDPVEGLELTFFEKLTDNSVTSGALAMTDKNGEFVSGFILNRDGLEVMARSKTHLIKRQPVDFDGPLVLVAGSSNPVHCSIVNEQGETLLVEGYLKVSGTGTIFSFHEGVAVLRDLKTGTNTVSLSSGGKTISLKNSTLVVPVSSTNITFTVASTRSLSVCVRDVDDDTVLEDAVVSVEQYGMKMEGRTKAGYTTFDVYEEQDSACIVRCVGYFPVQTNLSPTVESHTVYLKKAGVLSGSVQDAKKEPIGGAKVVLLYRNGSDKSEVTDARGAFRFIGLEKDVVKMVVRSQQHATKVEVIEVGQVDGLTVSLEEGERVKFNIETKIDVYDEKKIEEGDLVLINRSVNFPLASVDCKIGLSEEIQVMSDRFDIYWVSKDKKCAFKLKGVNLSESCIVDVSISEPNKKDVIVGEDEIFNKLFLEW